VFFQEGVQRRWGCPEIFLRIFIFLFPIILLVTRGIDGDKEAEEEEDDQSGGSYFSGALSATGALTGN